MEMKKRYTVLTYIFNGYEQVHEVAEKDPEADYVLVTDDAGLRSDTWRVVYRPELRAYSVFGRCYMVRFHPFQFVDTPIVVRVDGSIGINRSLRPVVDAFECGGFDRCLMIHPLRNLMRDEYDVWVRSRRYPRTQADKCLRVMERTGYDLGYRGLYQGCFEIVRNNDVNTRINDLTFSMLCLMGDGKIERIDQTVTSFVINRFFADALKVMPVAEDLITDGHLMQWYLHHSTRPIDHKRNTIPPMLFNRPCQPWCVNPEAESSGK